ARCDLRFEQMLEEGALGEAARMAARGLDLTLPAMKALGLRPLIRHLAGEIALEEAAAAGKAETRAYAKRQETWLKTQMIAWKPFYTQHLESLNAETLSFIDELGLTRS
ncbi:MAG: tRNA (adenosine(37)-N6)-dimethylallyltransferase MiaA, partial [Parvibaculum sp.]|nr:tRNA (adenosine(37)-N6)-dimethylallyltransferase MiaA [Parvibaculum sp.]